MDAAAPLKRWHVLAAGLGNGLEFYDFITFAYFAIQIGHAFFPAQSAYGSLMLSLATFGAGFVTRPVGAFVLGLYADRVGRRPAMVLSFTLMGSAIVGLALIPSYAAIGIAAPLLAVCARLVQGFSLGGELGANTTFLLESAAPEGRGLAVSWQGTSQVIAFGVGGAVGMILTHLLSPAALDIWGWRIAFLLGAATLPIGLWLRASLPETLHAPVAGHSEPVPDASRLASARRHWRIFALGFVVLAGATVGTYIFAYVATYAQNTLHMPPRAAFTATSAGSLICVFVIPFGGWLSDRIGRWPVNVGGNLAFLLLIYPVFAWISAARSEFALVCGVSALMVFSWVTVGPLLATLSESLPRNVRCTGLAFVYASAIALLGGTTQLVVTWLIHVTGNPVAPALYLTFATALAQIAYMLLPESAPVRLARTRLVPA